MSILAKHPIPEEGKIYKGSAPFTGRVVQNLHIAGQGSNGRDDVHHIVIAISGSGMRYLEGQSIGVIPPGERANGKKHTVRLYSIASCRDGDRQHPNTLTLTVKRTVYKDEANNDVRGICSNFLCDSSIGDTVTLTGPTGKLLLMPSAPCRLYLIATGTGIAPFRGFLEYWARYANQTDIGETTLFFGVKKKADLIYMNEHNNELAQYGLPGLQIVTALSREETTASGQKMYVQNRIEEHVGDIWKEVTAGNACFYICGLKGMEKGIEALFEEACQREGKEWKVMKKELRSEGRWNVEVY